jgi:hypothetical protein
MSISESTSDPATPAITGQDASEAGGGTGVLGISTNGWGVHGQAQGTAVFGESLGGWMGVYGNSSSVAGGAGVMGEAVGVGVYGKSSTSYGVQGECTSETGGGGVQGKAFGPGVVGESRTWHGTFGTTASVTGGIGVRGEHTAGGFGISGESLISGGVGVHGKGTRLAALFEGDVEVTGDIRLLNADCAEDFDVEPDASEPGTVVVIADEGRLRRSHKAYDRCVAGVMSGAGSFRPGMILDKQADSSGRSPLAMVGKVFCKVDAEHGAIEVGDLLTTSATPGHAMAARDAQQMVGAIIGKALRPLPRGRGLIPILVGLQ